MSSKFERTSSPEPEESLYEQVLQSQEEVKKCLEVIGRAQSEESSVAPNQQATLESHLAALEEANRHEQVVLDRWLLYVREKIKQI